MAHAYPPTFKRQKKFLFFLLGSMIMLFHFSLDSNPSTPTVVSGSAIFNGSGNELFVGTTSDRTIIDWVDFSIQQGQLTDFSQPSSTSAVLNRVTSANPSDILGQLKSNGQIFLINPNGILVGETGRVDVSALIASTLDVLNTDFLAGGDMTFFGISPATIQNSGLIEGTEDGVFLLGRHIINERDIIAISGRADIGAGESILLQSGNAGIVINASIGTPLGTGIENSGHIYCNQSALRADGNLYGLAIRHTGGIFAQSIVNRDGEIVLISTAGETRIEGNGDLLAHGNGVGGTIHVLGQTVTLQDQADLNTQNVLGGGEILIGGSEDNDPTILQALNTTVGPNVLISSDAQINGNAGTVVVFATNTANFGGRITATGGIGGGDGGFVELSGLINLIFTGTVDTRAPRGATGTLFLDPSDITISAGATAGGAFDGGSPTNTFSATAAAATLNNAALNTALQTNNVVVTTTSGFGSAGNITIGSATTLNLLTESHSLTLLADNNIVIGSTFTMIDSAGGTSTLNMTAGGDAFLTENMTATNLDAITISAAGDVIIENDFFATGASLSISAGGNIESVGGGDNDYFADQITFTAGTDILILPNELNSNGGGSSSNLSWTAGNEINIANDIDFNNWGTATLSTTSGDILIDNAIIANVVDTLTLSAGNDLINQGGTNLLNDLAGNQTDLNLIAARDVSIDSQIDINNFNSATISAGRDVLINQDFEPDNTTTVSINAVNDITTVVPGDIILASVTTFNMTTTNGDVNIGEGVTLAGANTNVTSGNDINILDVFSSTSGGDITFNAANDVNIGPATGLSLVGSRLGNVTVTTGRDLNVVGGATTGDRSQIGFSSVVVNSDIELTIGRDINVTAGSNSSSVAMIGHGFAAAGSYTGDIIINSVGRNVTLRGDTGATGSVKFAQIGHTRFTGGTSTFTGDIRGSTAGSPASITGDLLIVGGGDTTDFALFGHGGRDSNAIETYSGDIRVQANSITLTGGTSSDCFAAIGYHAVAQGAGTNPIVINPPATVQVISDTSIEMTASTNGIVSIGARALTDVDHLSIIRLDLVDIQTAGNLTMTSGTGVETDATIGAFSNAGLSETAISMDIGGGLFINAGTGAPARIINGTLTTALKDTTIDVAGDITPTIAGAFGAFIDGTTGNLTVTAGGTITMIDPLTFIRNSGGSNGTLSVTGGTTTLLSGGFFSNIGTGTTLFATTIGNLTILDGSSISSIGSTTGNIANDLILLDDATITSTLGFMIVTADRDISITGASGGSSSITSSGVGSYLAGRDITLIGTSATEEGFIENSFGNLTLAAGVDIEIDVFGRVENLGTGNLTLVTDNLFPTPPGIGPGAFDLSNLGSVGRLGGGPLRIFTAIREQNMIAGTGNINGVIFVPGPLFVDSATEQWGTYFPSSFGGVPFTIFYKNDAPVPPPSAAEILALDPNAFAPFAELFYILEGEPMDPLVAWLYDICINDDCLCLEQPYCHEKTLRYNYQICNCRKLPPYIKKLDLLPHH